MPQQQKMIPIVLTTWSTNIKWLRQIQQGKQVHSNIPMKAGMNTGHEMLGFYWERDFPLVFRPAHQTPALVRKHVEHQQHGQSLQYGQPGQGRWRQEKEEEELGEFSHSPLQMLP